jgi:outer membrane protein assembly factor BamE
MIIRFLFSLILATITCSGCNLIYKQNIQQGNAIEQDDLDELYIGMNQRQVLFVLGTPSVKDPFHDDRWDYVQTFSRRGNPMVQRTITLRFEDGLLTEIGGSDSAYHSGAGGVSGDMTEVASFVKKPGKSSRTSSAQDAQGSQDPQAAPLGAAEKDEAPGADLDIDTIQERTSEDTEYELERDSPDQPPEPYLDEDVDEELEDELTEREIDG